MSVSEGRSNSDRSHMNGMPNGVVRRSIRMRNSELENLNPSWILGGGGGALGYPIRLSVKRRNSKELNERDELKETGNEAATPQPESEDEEDEDGNDEVEESSDDLYGRVKNPMRRRSSRRIINYRETLDSMTIDDEPVSRRTRRDHKGTEKSSRRRDPIETEPVSRRLRDRTHIRRVSNGPNEHQPRDDVMKRHSHIDQLKKRGHTRRIRSSSSSSSDTDDRCSQSQSRSRRHMDKERNAGRQTCMGDMQPLAIESSITFASVGGLENHVNKLKEIVIFPLIYKEFFTSRNMTPPRGILFHGSPGTGKTLLARALANECSAVGGKAVSFFMRKGADILNKWVGESERQLKLLFEQASLHQPSIIFFDELDGLAPVRSSKTDQVHNSIVSTLLAELDGIKDRGDIIVIGATNRVDSIDPALRRPGRFDHEFPFFLPSHESRRSILNVHLKDWKDNPVSECFVDQLADMTVGYSGADLRLLCSEANMCALRRRYPQIYTSKDKLVLDYKSIQVKSRDWESAMTVITRSSNRSIFSSTSTGLPLPLALRPLLSRSVKLICEKLEKIFPYRSNIITEPSRKRLLVYSESIELSEHILPAVLHTMDSIPVYTLSLQTLVNENQGLIVASAFGEAIKRSTVSIIYIPSIDKIYQILSEELQQILLNELSKTAFCPVLILASANDALPEELNKYFGNVSMRIPRPSMAEKRDFFKPIFEINALQVKWTGGVDAPLEVLSIAPPEIKTFTADEIAKLEKKEARVMVQLKSFLRETIFKLVCKKKFVEFTKPVNFEEVPDYLDIISHPMDLETMMCKVNQGVYLAKADFYKDIELIVNNALNYNPAKSDTDLRIRHRAYELRDFVFMELDDMDSDFNDKCCSIKKAREKRQSLGLGTNRLPEEVKTDVDSSQFSLENENEVKSENLNKSSRLHVLKKRRIMSSWSRGILKTPTPKKFAKKSQIMDMSPCSGMDLSSSESLQSPPREIKREVSPENTRRHLQKPTGTRTQSPSSSRSNCLMLDEKPDEFGFIKSNKSSLYTKDLQVLLDTLLEQSSMCCTGQLLELRFQLLRATELHHENHRKKELILGIKEIIDNIKTRKSY